MKIFCVFIKSLSHSLATFAHKRQLNFAVCPDCKCHNDLSTTMRDHFSSSVAIQLRFHCHNMHYFMRIRFVFCIFDGICVHIVYVRDCHQFGIPTHTHSPRTSKKEWRSFCNDKINEIRHKCVFFFSFLHSLCQFTRRTQEIKPFYAFHSFYCSCAFRLLPDASQRCNISGRNNKCT